MFARLLSAFLLIALVTSGLVAQPAGKDKADPNDFVGKVVSVDVTKSTVTLSVDGKNRTFTVDDKTTIVGPRGGPSPERLKDDRFTKGYEIVVVAAADPKVAAKIRLDYRPREVKDAPAPKDKETPKDKEVPKDKDTTPKDKDKTTTPKDKDKTTAPAKDKDKTTPVKDKDKTTAPMKDKTTPVKDKKDK